MLFGNHYIYLGSCCGTAVDHVSRDPVVMGLRPAGCYLFPLFSPLGKVSLKRSLVKLKYYRFYFEKNCTFGQSKHMHIFSVGKKTSLTSLIKGSIINSNVVEEQLFLFSDGRTRKTLQMPFRTIITAFLVSS